MGISTVMGGGTPPLINIIDPQGWATNRNLK